MTERREAREFFKSGVTDYDRAQYRPAIRSFISDRNALLLDVLATLALPPGASLLEVGCGPGHFLAGAWPLCGSLTGVDTARSMLDLSRSRLPSPALAVTSFVGASITDLPFPSDRFDIIVSAGVLEYFPDALGPLRELNRVLRPGGVALLPTTNKLSPALLTVRLLDRLKRLPWLMRPFNRMWTRRGRPPIRPRNFRVRFDTPASHRAALRAASFTILAERFFHLAPLPSPAERLAPAVTTRLLRVTDSLLDTPLRILAEGHLAICTKTPAEPT